MAIALQSQNFETYTIHIPTVDLQRFKGLAKVMGWDFTKSSETLDELSDEECYSYLCKTRPEGQEPLSEKENEEFLNWLKTQ